MEDESEQNGSHMTKRSVFAIVKDNIGMKNLVKSSPCFTGIASIHKVR